MTNYNEIPPKTQHYKLQEAAEVLMRQKSRTKTEKEQENHKQNQKPKTAAKITTTKTKTKSKKETIIMKQGHQNSDGWQDDNDNDCSRQLSGRILQMADESNGTVRDKSTRTKQFPNTAAATTEEQARDYGKNFRIEGVEIEKQFSSQIHKPNHTHSHTQKHIHTHTHKHT